MAFEPYKNRHRRKALPRNGAWEFRESEYLKDKDGNYISGYPDENNHFQDAVRYMMNDEIMRTRATVKNKRY